jgi:hypothetical protein
MITEQHNTSHVRNLRFKSRTSWNEFIRMNSEELNELNNEYGTQVTTEAVKSYVRFNHNANWGLDGFCIHCESGNCVEAINA